MALDFTPGGVLLPVGLQVTDVIPGLGGRAPVTRGGRGISSAARSGRPPAVGPPVSYQRIYDTQSTVGTVVNKIARNFARVPWIVERLDPENRRYTRVEDDHELVQLLERPAPGLGPMAFKIWMAHGLLVEGNAVILQHRAVADGPPTELFPLDWRHLLPYRPAGGMIDRWITNETGVSRSFDRTEVLHLAWWSQGGAGGQVGLSPLEQLGTTLRLDDAAEMHSYAALAGGPNWQGAFKLPPEVKLTDEVAAALRTVLDSWEGADAAGVPILAWGAEYETFKQTAKDAALIETRHLGLERVCMVYDTSPTVIGVLRDATQRGNVAELNRDFYGNTLGPPLALTAEAINVQVIGNYKPWRDERLRVRPDPSEFLRGDPKEWDQIVNDRIRNGRLTLNDARELDGREPYDDEKAKEPLIADNNFHPLSQVGDDAGTGEGGAGS